VAYIFLPKYFRGDLSTAYEYLGTRFGARIQAMSSVTFMATRLLADGVRLFATAIPLKVIFDTAGFSVGYIEIIVGIGLITIFYTVYGGLKAVVWMDVVQMILYLGAAVLTLFLLIRSVNGNDLALLAGSGKLQIFEWGQNGLIDVLTRPYVFITAVIGGGIFSMASHGTDQLIVQRLLSCRTLRDSRRALVLSAVIVMFQFALFLGVGALLWAHYGGAGLSDLGLTRADEVFPKYIIEELPSGLSGLVLAGILAAAMSTLSSSLNALAASSVLDFKRFGRMQKSPGAVADDRNHSEHESSGKSDLVRSRVWTLVWGVAFMIFASLFTDRKNPVVELGLSIASFTYGALLGAFLLAVFTRRVRESDVMVGFVVSVVAMTLIIFGLWFSPESGWFFAFTSSQSPSVGGLPVSLAWPWYTALGALITVGVGSLLGLTHR